MAYLQFLTGSRAEEVVELNPAATLIVGSSAEAHIQLADPDVAPTHCQVYPAQSAFWLQDLGVGATILNMRRLTGETAGLQPKDVFIIGRTYVKFWAERPAAGAPAGADSGPALEAAQREITALKEEVERLRGWGNKGQELTDGLTEKLAEARDHLTKLRARLGELEAEQELTQGELASVQEELRAKEQERERLAQELDSAQGQLREARGELARLGETSGHSQDQLRQLNEELTKTRKGHETARVDAKRLQVELGVAESQLAEAKVEAESRLTEVEATLGSTLTALEASRAALESLGVGRPADSLDELETPLGEVLEQLELSEGALDRLEAALRVHVDVEVLRRLAGPQLRWERPDESVAREELLTRLRARGARLDLALALGVPKAGGDA